MDIINTFSHENDNGRHDAIVSMILCMSTWAALKREKYI